MLQDPCQSSITGASDVICWQQSSTKETILMKQAVSVMAEDSSLVSARADGIQVYWR